MNGVEKRPAVNPNKKGGAVNHVTSSVNEQLPIDIASMAYFHYEYNKNIISNLVKDAICTNADSIAIRESFEFNTSRWARLCTQSINMGRNSILDLGG